MTLGSQRLPQGTYRFGLSSNFVILGSYAVDKRKGLCAQCAAARANFRITVIPVVFHVMPTRPLGLCPGRIRSR